MKLEIILATDILAKPRLSEDIDTQILELETTFDQTEMLTSTYNEIFRNATGSGRAKTQYDVICTALRWVLCSFRSLTARELAYASSISPDGTFRKGVSESFILANCANLLVERQHVGVGFAHLSVAEFLKITMPSLFSLPKSHVIAAVTCLLSESLIGSSEYLPVGASVSDPRPPGPQHQLESPEKQREDGKSHTGEFLKDYSSLYWPRHCREAEDDSRLQELIPPTQPATMHNIIRNSDHDALRAAIAAKADLNPVDEDKNTAIHTAVKLQDATALRILILAGADCNTYNLLCQSPLHTASFNNDSQCLHLLVHAGADKNAQDMVGATPLHYAAYHDNVDALRFLAAVGARSDLANHRGKFAAEFSSRSRLSKFNEIFTKGSVLTRHLEHFVDSNLPEEFAYFHCNRGITKNDEKLTVLGHLCPYCNISQWLEEPSADKRPHWTSLARLKDSADEGCELCGLFLSGLSRQPDVHDHWYDTQVWTRVILSSDSVDRKDVIIASLGSIARYEVELCHDPQQMSDLLLSGINLEQRSDSPGTFSKLQSWIDTCDTSHSQCKVRLDSTSLPTRLIDISSEKGQDKVYQVLGTELVAKRRQSALNNDSSRSDEETKYAFLSHKWGDHIVPPSAIKIHEDAEMGIEVAELEKTFQDAIDVLRHVGIRYFWVDKLCIDWITPQSEDDADDDSTKETAKLAHYVANAALVINAGVYHDGDGLFQERSPARNLLELSYSFGNGENTQTGLLCFREPVRSAAEVLSDFLSSRAWIFQEITLPKRVIIYGPDQVYWKCHTYVQSEGSLWMHRPAVDFPPFAVYEGTDAQLFDRWYKMVELFSSKEINFFDHKIMAVQGMAERTKDYLSKPSYRGALWEEDWQRGLLWYSRTHAKAWRPPNAQMPTWSWASLNGPVSYSLLHGLVGIGQDDGLIIGMSTWMDIDHSFELPTISNVLSRRLHIGNKDETCQVLFDTLEDERNWCAGNGYIAVLINRWSPECSEEYFRWAGLLLEASGDKNGFFGKAWYRRGVVLGPWSDHDMRDWSRGTFPFVGDGALHERRHKIQKTFLTKLQSISKAEHDNE